jgi:anti-sigma B factor antagonist
MNLSAAQQGSVMVIAISGDVDAMTAPDLSTFLDKQLQAGFTQLIVDCRTIGYLGSAGVRIILHFLKATRQAGGDLRLANIQPEIFKVFDMTGIAGITHFYDDIPSAVASFAQ